MLRIVYCPETVNENPEIELVSLDECSASDREEYGEQFAEFLFDCGSEIFTSSVVRRLRELGYSGQ